MKLIAQPLNKLHHNCIIKNNFKREKNWKLITSRNLAFENRLRSFLKTNDQQVSIDLLDTLAIQSVHLVKDEATVTQPDTVMW